MKKVRTVAAKQSRKTSEQKLTVGLDLGDRSTWYCVVDESGTVVLEQRPSTTPQIIAWRLPTRQSKRPRLM
jgi:transposase